MDSSNLQCYDCQDDPCCHGDCEAAIEVPPRLPENLDDLPIISIDPKTGWIEVKNA